MKILNIEKVVEKENISLPDGYYYGVKDYNGIHVDYKEDSYLLHIRDKTHEEIAVLVIVKDGIMTYEYFKN